MDLSTRPRLFDFYSEPPESGAKGDANRIIGAGGQGAGIAAIGSVAGSSLTLQNGATVTGNLASGRYSQGGGLYTEKGEGGALTVAINSSNIDTNKVTGSVPIISVTGTAITGATPTNCLLSPMTVTNCVG